MSLARARAVADAVLYEGYVLYPYRASAQKNRVRWQFGVLAPRTWSEGGGCEHWWMQTECLAQPRDHAGIAGTVRFLQVQARIVERSDDPVGHAFTPVPTLEAEDRLWTSWEEGVEREVHWEIPLSSVGSRSQQLFVPFAFPAARESEALRRRDGRLIGRLLRQRAALEGAIRVTAEPAGADGLAMVRIRIENLSSCDALPDARDEALPAFMVGTHTLLVLIAGSFVSLTDPPDWARAVAAACNNVRTWPVLIGDRGEQEVMLSSPIILQDHPEIAPESPGDLCDATEIDEILTLRTMALTDDEKREARATDARAASIIDRVDTMPPEIFERLHGAIRSLRRVAGGEERSQMTAEALAPWWDPGVDASVSPDTDQIDVDGVAVAKGSRVRLRPGIRRADAQDLFLAGRTARVEGVFLDVDERRYLAVTLEDDPAAELHQVHGRYLYFAPDEIEPLEEGP